MLYIAILISEQFRIPVGLSIELQGAVSQFKNRVTWIASEPVFLIYGAWKKYHYTLFREAVEKWKRWQGLSYSG